MLWHRIACEKKIDLLLAVRDVGPHRRWTAPAAPELRLGDGRHVALTDRGQLFATEC
jgi:hypothetical protein